MRHPGECRHHDGEPGTQVGASEDAQPRDEAAIAEAIVGDPEDREDGDAATEHRPGRPTRYPAYRGRRHGCEQRRGTDLEHDDRGIRERDLRDAGRAIAAEPPQQRDPRRHRRLPLDGSGEEGAGVRGVQRAKIDALGAGGTQHGAPGLRPQTQREQVGHRRPDDRPGRHGGDRVGYGSTPRDQQEADQQDGRRRPKRRGGLACAPPTGVSRRALPHGRSLVRRPNASMRALRSPPS